MEIRIGDEWWILHDQFVDDHGEELRWKISDGRLTAITPTGMGGGPPFIYSFDIGEKHEVLIADYRANDVVFPTREEAFRGLVRILTKRIDECKILINKYESEKADVVKAFYEGG